MCKQKRIIWFVAISCILGKQAALPLNLLAQIHATTLQPIPEFLLGTMMDVQSTQPLTLRKPQDSLSMYREQGFWGGPEGFSV